LAKLVADRQAITVDGEAVGTLLYTAPEQLRGERVDHRADLWSLGAVAYEMISGVSPFRGDSPASTMMRILASEPAPLISVPGVSSELSGVVSRLLQKNPENRIQSAEGVIASLETGSTVTVVPKRRVVGVQDSSLPRCSVLQQRALSSCGRAFGARFVRLGRGRSGRGR
jgi:serine/threonine protein kinase